MDFDDLIWRTVPAFEKDAEVLDYYREKFRYIMVDEYQGYQLHAVPYHRLLAEKPEYLRRGRRRSVYLPVEGADIRNILSFEKDFPGTEGKNWNRITVPAEIF